MRESFMQLWNRLRHGGATEAAYLPVTLPQEETDIPRQLARYLARRSRSPLHVMCSLDRPALLTRRKCEWPADRVTPCPTPDEEPEIMQSCGEIEPTRLPRELPAGQAGQAVVHIEGIEHFERLGLPFDWLRELADQSRYLLLSASSGTDASRAAFQDICARLDIPPSFTGSARGNEAPFPCALAGHEARPPVAQAPVKSLALMCVFNEVDIIEPSIRALLDQGLDVFVIDDGSTDGTLDRLEALARQTGRLFLDKHLPGTTPFYNVDALFKRKLEIANRALSEGYTWMMHVDADEVRTSPWPGITLAQAFARVEALGYNAVDFTVIDFRFLKGHAATDEPPEARLRHFEFGRRLGHFIQIKAWRHAGDISPELALTCGHEASFAGRRVFPLKFLLKHYPLRSIEHARTKIYRERLPRFAPERVANGMHIQYDMYKEREPEGWDAENLLVWDDRFHSNYMVERLSGVGLQRNNPGA